MFLNKYYVLFKETCRTSTGKYGNQTTEVSKCIYRTKYPPKKLPNYSNSHPNIGTSRN